MSKSIVELLKDSDYKEKLITSLNSGIPENYQLAFNELINYVIDKLISIPEYKIYSLYILF